ncbi:MAG: aminotransferase class I/II-fold pyridoxal phosphate-dependent enzyme [Lachnospiraceae bacterium]|nr:aminotransferase class I/II-fold pyridoxal phosphate-dependent enzyme [Lachnospiraceae bacterium]
MKAYKDMTKEELMHERDALTKAYKEWQGKGLTLNMARGKPSEEQLDLSIGLLNNIVDEMDVIREEKNIDLRNYGGLEGISGARELLATMMEVTPDDVLVYGNSSLNMMFDTISRAWSKGILGHTPWCQLDKVKFLCPVPGYDRHFAICEYFGIEMIPVPMHVDGPDMDMVEELVSSDDSIKGILCVPKFSNPQGIVYSDEVVKRFAALKPKAEDFRIFWDNAYCVHYLYEEIKILNIIEETRKAGNPDIVFEFCSTSKVSFAGAGISGMAASEANRKDALATMTVMTIGHDKVNQLRHALFFERGRKIKEHMEKHAALLRPRFEIVNKALEKNLGGKEIGTWLKPKGGYFITFEALEGCATRIVQLAKECGVVMTGAGAPFPYHKDPRDSVIRIAPSYPSREELKEAAEIFTICVRLASVEKFLGENA